MDSAIPKHLRTEISQPRTMPQGFVPPFPAWTTRFAEDTSKVVMMYIGIQSQNRIYFTEIEPIIHYLKLEKRPGYWTPAEYIDAQGFHNLIITAYWINEFDFNDWFNNSGFVKWWNSEEREQEQYGYFLEISCPSISEFETIFSHPSTPEGIAHLSLGMSDEIQEHGYYGSMRDRLPAAQNNDLKAKYLDHEYVYKSKNRIHIYGHNQLCLIRSGQDWGTTQGVERSLYLEHVEPTLKKGMDFLRDEGIGVGCLNCRYMTVLDPQTGEPTSKTFGLAYFTDLQSLEQWAKSHPTHVAIFGEFMTYVQKMNFQINLKLFHEVISVPKQSQFFEYINCHLNTGLLSKEVQ